MATTINGRTPEEIKRGLECCSVDGLSCSNCSYCVSCDADIHALERDALAYIQQLERERDAAVEILRDFKMCAGCDHKGCADCRWFDDVTMKNKDLHDNWQWRGVQEEVKPDE